MPGFEAVTPKVYDKIPISVACENQFWKFDSIRKLSAFSDRHQRSYPGWKAAEVNGYF